MPDKNLIQEKLKSIALYVKELEPILELSFKDFSKNYRDYRTAERSFQLAVDSAVDINVLFILEKGKQPPENNFQSFVVMAELGILEDSFSKEIAPSTGLRNRLVHEYEKVDLDVFYRSLKKFVPFYFEYIKKIEDYLSLGNRISK
ncbi:MAG: hypothetical protein COT67_00660 [Candidatus Tagabacteria bacterium CG09_land_8_20_14_0_10_41_14]|uniref:DUF86 domain-containing protein n=2 Tax=Candidatus Tagaibacteriota TaxID=1817918 RepID=A0A2H0WLT2_9BACT|nr:MAG: hypothetical protein COT67_00660 [Candidatus Tagabacteria bacterium CG09_land_8_20_14_0_10_41_14]PJE73276.1 MAG: hypothetical protein COV00_00690 [Candidatus Tagabacteria bacterium CG10_big_fil_rev_8_21_14_0_10_40_13]